MTRILVKHEVEAIARAAHEVNRAWNHLIEDYTHKIWDETSEDLKAAARISVVNIAEHNFTAEQCHDSWVAWKSANGYTFAKVKDDATKSHPGMVAWAELPSEQQNKDKLWVTVVNAIINSRWTIPQ